MLFMFFKWSGKVFSFDVKIFIRLTSLMRNDFEMIDYFSFFGRDDKIKFIQNLIIFTQAYHCYFIYIDQTYLKTLE